ncbi:sulfurtransferase [soil metagenome]
MDYARPESLVSADWLKQHLSDPNLRIIEVDVDPKQYHAGHIPGAIGLDWAKDLQDPLRRDIPSKAQLEHLLGSRGVNENHDAIIYGDSSNWFAAYAFWVMKLYGHKSVRLLNGGRSFWLNSDKLPLTPELPTHPPTEYHAQEPDPALRARVGEVLAAAVTRETASAATAARTGAMQMVDVRSPDEFSGKVIAPPGMSETAQRAGHIPGAVNVPWAQTVNADGTFKSRDELATLYAAQGLFPATPTISYCRIGERSSHTWFVLKYLLGFDNVRNYDGSWTEYGNLIGATIRKPD